MTNPDTLLVFDETVTRAGVEGWLRHLESAGAPTEMYRLGGTLVLSVADVDLIHRAGPELPEPTRQVSRNSKHDERVAAGTGPGIAIMTNHTAGC